MYTSNPLGERRQWQQQTSLQMLTVLDSNQHGIQLGWLEHNSIVLDLYGKEERAGGAGPDLRARGTPKTPWARAVPDRGLPFGPHQQFCSKNLKDLWSNLALSCGRK